MVFLTNLLIFGAIWTLLLLSSLGLVLARDDLPNGFEPYTAEEVGEARVKVLADPLRTRQEILEDS